MDKNLKIKVKIANRLYPLTVSNDKEEIIRKSSKKIDNMIEKLEGSYAVRDKQDVLAMCALQIFAYPFTGASFNPVRAFSPVVVAWNFEANLVIYMIAPVIGALFGAIIYILAFTNDPLRFGFDYNAPKSM